MASNPTHATRKDPEKHEVADSRPLSSPPAVPPEVAGASPADRCGRFVRVAKLGSGGMGDVWKAWDTELARWVALKFLRSGNEMEIARFKREAHLAGKLAHSNVAAIYEVGEIPGPQARHYIAMQFIEGRTLKGFSRADFGLIARLLRDAARAVQYAHEQGIVHRDIKPENLMVVDRGKTPGGKRATEHQVYVMDFGLARPMEGATELSIPGTVVGTPGYMSPEQARGEAVNERSDVYSLGATLYALLADAPPFDGPNVLQTLKMVQEEQPRALRKIDPRIPPDLETIALKCLEKEPSRRYASAAELADDLTRWLNGEPLQAHAPSYIYRLRRAALRHRAAIVPVIALLLLAAVVVIRMGLAARSRADLEARAHTLEEETQRARHQDEAFKLLEMARPALDRAARLRDKDAEQAQRLLDQAIQQCTAALELDPDFPEALHHRGLCRKLRGDAAGARADFERALKAAAADWPGRARVEEELRR